MKKPATKNRDAKAAQVRSVLDENKDLFEVRFLDNVDWFEDVKDALCRFVVTSSALSDKELQAKLTEKDHLKLVLLEDLRAHGLTDEEADAAGEQKRRFTGCSGSDVFPSSSHSGPLGDEQSKARPQGGMRGAAALAVQWATGTDAALCPGD
jgi:hypothetical protein